MTTAQASPEWSWQRIKEHLEQHVPGVTLHDSLTMPELCAKAGARHILKPPMFCEECMTVYAPGDAASRVTTKDIDSWVDICSKYIAKRRAA